MSKATESDLTAEALRLLRDRGSDILNAIDDGVYCLDAEGRTIFVNEAAARMLGYTQRELLGRPQHETIHHHYADGTVFPQNDCPIFLAVFEGVQQRVGGDVFWKKNGERLWIDYTAIPLKEGRQVLGAVITFRDISAQQKPDEQDARSQPERAAPTEAETASVALEHNEEMEMRRAFEQAPAAMATIEASSLVFTTANAYYRKLHGGRDVVGKPIAEAIPEFASQPSFVDMLQEVIRSGRPHVGEQVPMMVDRGDGTTEQRRFDFVYQPLTAPDGQVNGVMIHATDLTAVAAA